MNVNVLFFGMIAEALKCNVYPVVNFEGKTVGELEDYLRTKLPDLSAFTYQIALDQTLADRSEKIVRNCEVAFLPPFAGG